MHTIILLGHKPFAKIFQTLTLDSALFCDDRHSSRANNQHPQRPHDD
jgi:hypothetical protein